MTRQSLTGHGKKFKFYCTALGNHQRVEDMDVTRSKSFLQKDDSDSVLRRRNEFKPISVPQETGSGFC